MATGSFEFPRCDWASQDHISIKNHYVFSIDIYMIKPMKNCSWFINRWIPKMKQKNYQFISFSKLALNIYNRMMLQTIGNFVTSYKTKSDFDIQ